MELLHNVTAQENLSTKQFLVSLLYVENKALTIQERILLTEVLINEKTLSEAGKRIGLTSQRQRTVLKSGIGHLLGYLGMANEKLFFYDALIEELVNSKGVLKKISNSDLNSANNSRDQLFFSPISQLDFSGKVKAICSRAKINTVKDLVAYSKCDFGSLPNCGKKSIDEVESFFKQKNIRWEMSAQHG